MTQPQQRLGNVEPPHVDGFELFTASLGEGKVHLPPVLLAQTAGKQAFPLGRLDDLRHIRRREVEPRRQFTTGHAPVRPGECAQQHPLIQRETEQLFKPALKPHDAQIQISDAAQCVGIHLTHFYR